MNQSVRNHDVAFKDYDMKFEKHGKILGISTFLAAMVISCIPKSTELSMATNVDCNQALILPQCRATVQELIARRQFGFHVTATENVASIMNKGLLASQGGKNPKGLCSLMAGMSCSKDIPADEDYRGRSLGYLFFAKDLNIVAKFLPVNDSAGVSYTILGIRLGGLEAKGYEVDPDYGRGAFRTKQDVPPSQLVVLGTDIEEIKKNYLPKKSFFPCFGPR